MEVSGSSSPEEVLLRLLDTQEELDRWLLERRDVINDEIERGLIPAPSNFGDVPVKLYNLISDSPMELEQGY